MFNWLFCVITEVPWSMLGEETRGGVKTYRLLCDDEVCVLILFYFIVIW